MQTVVNHETYSIRQIGGHDEIVLHDEAGLLGVQNETLDHLRRYFWNGSEKEHKTGRILLL